MAVWPLCPGAALFPLSPHTEPEARRTPTVAQDDRGTPERLERNFSTSFSSIRY
jgi:hypothetical protein